MTQPGPSVAILGTRGYPSYYGGFETAIRKLAPFLADAGWDVTVYGRHGSTRDDDPDLDDRVRRVITRGTESKSLSTLSYGFWAAMDAIRRKPDVALIMNVANGFWLPLLRLRGIPTVVNVDGIEWERAKWGRLARTVFRAGARLTAWFASSIVVDAHEIGRYWNERFRRQGVFIPYGGDAPPTVLPLEPGLESRRYALLVARFVPENSVPEFLEAAAVIAQDADVVLVGSEGYGGELDARARELADSSPRIQWLGHVNDDSRLLSLWQHAGVYFHGHSVGGTNPALVQAMACGAPIIARDTVYNREVLGDAGVFVAPDPRQIVDSVRSMLAAPERQSELSARSRARAAAVYTTVGVNTSYEELLASLVRRPR